MQFGTESLVSEVSWKFSKHQDGSDFYEIQLTYKADGGFKKSSRVVVEFDGETEATVLDAEQYIVIHKGFRGLKHE